MKSFHDFFVKGLMTLVVIVGANVVDAGTRYKDIVFVAASGVTGIPFGSNLNIDGSTATLSLDLYQPTGDTLTSRPLVICIHGGSLTVGSRIEMSPFCIDLAQRGYVAATIDYRVGIESPNGVKTVLEATLRGVQDTKAAVRFLRSHAAQYGIDTSRIYLEGSSAGSVIAVHYAYWSQDEIPSDINQAKWGNIEGASGNPGVSSSIKGIVNYCGAIVDQTWIDPGEIPVANFHGLLDTVVPPDSGLSGAFGIVMQGGVAISRTATRLGVYNQGAFFPNMAHGGNEDSLRLFSSNFIYSLMVLSSASPTDFASITLSPKSQKVFLYDNYTFSVSSVDMNGNRIILPQSMIQYSCDSKIGSIASSGVFTPSGHPDSGYVRAKLNNSTDSCYVKTYDFKYFIVRPRVTVTDTLRTLKVTIDTYDADSVKQNFAISYFTLTSTDPSIGSIDPKGIFTAKKNGTTRIVAVCNGYRDTSVVRVESASGIVNFDLLESISGWTFTGVSLDSLSVTVVTDQKSAGNSSFMVKYKFTYDPDQPVATIYLSKDLLVYGIPDSIYLDVKSDGRNHRLYYLFSDADSELFRGAGQKFLNNSSKFDNVNASMLGLSPLVNPSELTYPLTLKRLEIRLAGDNVPGNATSGTIYLDNLRLKYPGNITGVEKMSVVPVLYRLEQNYPNPFNPSTVISYQLPVKSYVSLKVYDLLGREVAELVNEVTPAGKYDIPFDAATRSSGIYFYRLKAGSYVETKKMILLK